MEAIEPGFEPGLSLHWPCDLELTVQPIRASVSLCKQAVMVELENEPKESNTVVVNHGTHAAVGCLPSRKF